MQQRADLISAQCYDDHSKEQFESRIDELADLIEGLRHRKSKITHQSDELCVSFFRFLEPRENLLHYWVSADFEQKAKISKIIVLNLNIRDKEVAISSWKKPFSDDEEGLEEAYGGAQGEDLELKLQQLRHWYFAPENEEIQDNLNQLSSELSCEIQPKYKLVKDIAKIT